MMMFSFRTFLAYILLIRLTEINSVCLTRSFFLAAGQSVFTFAIIPFDGIKNMDFSSSRWDTRGFIIFDIRFSHFSSGSRKHTKTFLQIMKHKFYQLLQWLNFHHHHHKFQSNFYSIPSYFTKK